MTTVCRILLTMMVLQLPLMAAAENCPVVHITPERLPDLTMPRSGCNIFYANGELTVTGGHTTNFVPTTTAEYFADGEWHQMTMAYAHDNGFAVPTRSGEIIIGGGHTEPLGIGQTFMVERYSPKTHTFEGFGCLDRRRVLANATLMDDGRVIICGNHYAADAIGCYEGRSQVEHVKDVVQGRSNPYILRTSNDDAIIIGANDQFAKRPDTIWADRLKSDPFRVPLLEQWRLVPFDQPFSSDACLMSNDKQDGYTYLLTATDKNGQLGFVMVRDTCFSLLPTACPVPMRSPWGAIFYKGPIIVDRQRQRGYVMGVDSLYSRQYVLSVDYSQRPAALTLYHTEAVAQATITIPVVTPDGDLILAGGIPGNNYKPLADVWLYHFGTDSQAATWGLPTWLWVVIAVTMVAALAYIVYHIRRRRNTPAIDAPPTNEQSTELMERICYLMEHNHRYLTARLKASDVAAELGVSVTAVTDCINRQRGLTFALLMAEYRVRHAQQLLTDHPDMKLAAVINESGFTSESTFFRTFKTITGMSPKEWLAQQDR